MLKIDIPQIYEEDIIVFSYRRGNAEMRYYDGDKVFQILFSGVYLFDFIEFDYINDTKWRFGLHMLKDSPYIKKMISAMPKEKIQRSFGGEVLALRHYTLVIDDVGMYNIVCKDIMLKYVSE